MSEINTLTPPNTVLQELGKRLAKVRKQHKLSQVDLAAQAGLGVATLKRIEAGSDSQLESWIKLLTALDLMEGIDGLVPASQRSPMTDATASSNAKPKLQTQTTTTRWGDES